MTKRKLPWPESAEPPPGLPVVSWFVLCRRWTHRSSAIAARQCYVTNPLPPWHLGFSLACPSTTNFNLPRLSRTAMRMIWYNANNHIVHQTQSSAAGHRALAPYLSTNQSFPKYLGTIILLSVESTASLILHIIATLFFWWSPSVLISLKRLTQCMEREIEVDSFFFWQI